MRLKTIRLAGFKSFVDPTTVPFPNNLSAIVGPNGCGKSNIIDAVRWVMGESSARYLRGESMADVIFNGSTTRKPVGQASIELVFDNQDGSLGGEYGRYSEIAVRRQVTRDGKSEYFLNGSRCRRKDITDIFLGTGLGPRSYAIIEQGMISRLVEARPEELRNYIEEAAGISRYKERRKETETRLANTRENLARLNDIREELGRQLAHLQRQADAAEKYRRYKTEERELRAQLYGWRLQSLQAGLQEVEAVIRQQAEMLSGAMQSQQGVEQALSEAREREERGHGAVLEARSRVQAVQHLIAQAEQQMQHLRTRQSQLEQQSTVLRERLARAEEEGESDGEELAILLARKEELAPRAAAATAGVAERQAAVDAIESDVQQLQANLEACQREVTRHQMQVQAAQSRIHSLEQGLLRSQERRQKLAGELGSAATDELLLDVESRQEELALFDERIQETQAGLEALGEALAREAGEQQALGETLHRLKTVLQQGEGELSALLSLQQAALGRDNAALNAWMQKHGVSSAPRLGEVIRVAPGHEALVEAILGEALSALVVEDIAGLDVQGAPGLMLVEAGAAQEAHGLAATVEPGVAREWLVGVEVCDSLVEAMSRRDRLGLGDSLITRDGYWLGRHWLTVLARRAEDSVIVRQARIADLQATLAARETELRDGLARQSTLAESLRAGEQQRGREQRVLSELLQSRGAMQSGLARAQAQLTQAQLQGQRLREELAELEAHQRQDAESLAEERLTLEDGLAAWQREQARERAILDGRESLRAGLARDRQLLQELRAAQHALALETQGLHTRELALRQGLQRGEQHRAELRAQIGELERGAEDTVEPVAELVLRHEDYLAEKEQLEDALRGAEAELQESARLYRALEHQRHELSSGLEPLRRQLENNRLQWQDISSRQTHLREQLAELGVDIDEVLGGLPAELDENVWQARLEQLGQKISRLGAINLAAIEEFQEVSGRKAFLDAQSQDLEEAVEKLEGAIRHIDKETRTLFMETYNQVNQGLKTLFPKVFGGGEASLDLVGDDTLSSGVTIMARPPGKKNATIHLLSGGEKALTALSLVFAIFQLNPAPFCILDEVDAPLDDANVGRFCRLVEEMAQKVQFIYITHNKIAMAMAQQLMGVTMHEPGVSRLVTVDVEQAAALAAA